jgi:hypothetical protein
LKHYIVKGKIISDVAITIEASSEREALDIAKNFDVDEWLEHAHPIEDTVPIEDIEVIKGNCLCDECAPPYNGSGSSLVQ